MLTDKQLRHLYRYHKRGGFYPTVVYCISQCILTYMAIWFLVHVLMYVNYASLIEVPYKGPFWVTEPHQFIMRKLLIFQCYLSWFLLVALRIKDISNAYEAHVIWSKDLDLCPNDVPWILWDSVMEKVEGTETELKQRLLRMDNYMTAMAIEGVFGIPDTLYTSFFVWIIKRVFENALQITQSHGFPREFLYQVNTGIYTKRLQITAVIFGAVGLLICPAVALLKVLELLIQSMTMYQQDPGNFGKHAFTQMAKTQLRDFNELPHVYQYRLFKCREIIKQVIQYDSPSVGKEMLRFTERLVTSLLGLLVLLTLVNQNLVTNVRIWGHNLIFWLGTFGLVYLICKTDAIGIEEQPRDPHDLLNELVQELHLVPPQWYSMGIKAKYATIGKLYRLTIIMQLTDILAILALPFLIGIWIPQIACKLITVIQYMSMYDETLGVFCKYSSTITLSNIEASSRDIMEESMSNSDNSTPYASLYSQGHSVNVPATITSTAVLTHSSQLQDKMTFSTRGLGINV